MPTGRSSASSISKSLRICETFVSICGESTRQGLPAWFVRLSGCDLRCAWCDTSYSWEEGVERSIDNLLDEAKLSAVDLAVVTGGEPLLQGAVQDLLSGLADSGFVVLLETNGQHLVADLDPRVIRILDVKPPSANVAQPFLLMNLEALRLNDELKFVIADRRDFDFAVQFVGQHQLAGRCHLLLSPIGGRLAPEIAAQWLLEAKAPFRLQLQLHKILWGDGARGR